MKLLSMTYRVAGAMALSATLGVGSASALTLDTTWLQANAVFALSQDAYDAMSLTSTSMAALGNASAVTGDALPAFNLPVTQVDVSLGLPPFSPLVTPNSGEAAGSALLVSRGSYSLTLANFVIDYDTDLVMADITANGVTTKGASLYTFDATDLSIGLKGLTLNMHQTLSNLTLTSSAVNTFASALGLNKVFTSVLTTLNFGTITIDINGSLRTPISSADYVASVPETPPLWTMGLGLVGIAGIARRKQAT